MARVSRGPVQCAAGRTPFARRRRGFALVPVMLLVSAMLLVALAFTDAVLLGMRGARLGWQGERATHAADAALLRTMVEWDRATAAALMPGETDTVATRSDDGLTALVVRTRVHARLFALEAWARVQDGGARPARRAVGRTVRLDWPYPPVYAALTVGGALRVGDSVTILGADAVPAGWDAECALDQHDGPLVAIAAGAATIAPASVVEGAGAPVHSLDDSALVQMAATFDAAFAALATVASVTTNDGVLSLDDRAVGLPGCPLWFGDGARGLGVAPECARRWPIVRAAAPDSVRLIGSTAGQGILLVDGDLVLREGVTLHGLVMVRGRVRGASSGVGPRSSLIGALVVRDRGAAGSALDALRLYGSRCAVRRALAAAGLPVPIGPYGWGERP